MAFDPFSPLNPLSPLSPLNPSNPLGIYGNSSTDNKSHDNVDPPPLFFILILILILLLIVMIVATGFAFWNTWLNYQELKRIAEEVKRI